MNDPNAGNEPVHTLDRGECLRAACAAFQSALESGQPASLEAALAGIPKPWRESAFSELLRIELAHSQRSGRSRRAEEYRERFPEFAATIETVLSGGDRPTATNAEFDTKTGTGTLPLPASSPSPLKHPKGTRGQGEGVLRKLGRFELLEKLGEGAFGTVYLARDPQLDRDVAIKIPRAGTLHDDRAAQRFLREARAAAQLRHPNIVPIHDAGQIDGTYYIASGFIKEQTLREVMKNRAVSQRLPSPLPQGRGAGGEGAVTWPSLSETRGRTKPQVSERLAYMPEREAALLISKLAAALHYAHTQGIIHRDIKPENIMVDESGEPHAMDFGLARREEGEEHQTREGVQMGTAAYMSPEQARGESHLADARSDLWSLGVVLYELLTGQRPFATKSFDALMLDILRREPLPAGKINRKLPRDLDTICQKCLVKERLARYSDCRELAYELNRYLVGEPIKARRITPIERTWRWSKRRPAVAALSLALLCILVSAAIIGPMVALHQNRLAKEKAAAVVESQEALLQQLVERGSNAQMKGEYRFAVTLFANVFARTAQDDRLRETARSFLAISTQSAPMLLLHSEVVGDIAFSPTGDRTLTGSYDKTARLWDAKTGKPFGEPMRHDGAVYSVAFSPTGDRVLTRSAGKSAQLWDAKTGKPLGESMRHDLAVRSVAFSPTGDRVLTASDDKTARLWDAKTGKPLGEPMRHDGAVYSVAFSPTGDRVLTGSEDKTARLWDAKTGKPLGELMRHDERVRSVAFSPTGDQVLTASNDKTARLWDAKTGKPLGEPMRHDGPVGLVAFSPTGDQVLTASNDKTAWLWDAPTGRPVGELIRHDGPVGLVAVAFSPMGDRVLTGSEDKTARLWDAKTGKPLGEPMRHDLAVRSVAFSPTGDRVLTGSWDNTVRLWDAKTGKPLGEPMQHDAAVYSVAFSPMGNHVLTGSEDKTARLWDAKTGKPLGEPMRHDKRVCSVAFSPTGDRVLTASHDKTTRLWDAKTGKPLGEPTRHDGGVNSVAFSPTGDRVLTGSYDKTAQLWDAKTGKPLGEPMRHDGGVNSVAFSPTGDRVLTGSGDKTARLWDAKTGKLLGEPMRHDAAVYSVAFSPTGDRVLTGSFDNTARLWELPLLPSDNSQWLSLFAKVRTGLAADGQSEIRKLSQGEWLQAWAEFEKVGTEYLAEEKHRWEERHRATTNSARQPTK